MENNTIPAAVRPIKILPQLLTIIFWIAEIFLTLDSSSFILSFAWPIPYKDAFYEDFSLFYLVYSIIILLICTLSLIKPKLAAIPIPLIVIFEIYTLISPILYKALYYSGQHAGRYALSIFDPTKASFYLHTLKSFILIAIAVMLFFAIIGQNRKTAMILFTISCVLSIATIIPLVIEMNSLYAVGTLDAAQYSKLLKSVCVGAFRLLPLLPLFFITDKKNSKIQ